MKILNYVKLRKYLGLETLHLGLEGVVFREESFVFTNGT